MGEAMPRPIALMTILLLAACGEDLVEPTSAVLELRTVTTGAPIDPDGYAVRLDGGPPATIGANVTLSIPDLVPGEHSIELVGLAPNCLLTGANPRTVTANAGGVVRERFEVACSTFPGSLEVSVVTSGESPDPDGYLILLDDVARGTVASNGAVTLSNVVAGTHAVGLSGWAANCAVAGDNPKLVTVGSERVRVDLEVRCGPPSGTIRVVTTTRGARPDPDGYVAMVNDAEHAVGANATLTVPDLPAGDVVVELTGVAANCVVDGGATRAISLGNGTTYVLTFEVSCIPIVDGTLLFFSDRSGVSHLYRVKDDGSQLRDLTPSMEAFRGDWSPDGTRIVFAATAGLFVMNADGSAPKPLGVQGSAPKWSPDGRRILFNAGGAVNAINADGSGATMLAEGGDGTWSPDGAKIAFDRIDRTRCVPDLFCPSSIYVMTADGTAVTRLTTITNASDKLGSPAWSPDGSSIAYIRSCCFLGPDVSGIYVMDARGGLAHQIGSGSTGGAPVWSPDGGALAVAMVQPNRTTELTLIPSTGGAGVVLATSPSSEYPTAWR
jgi:Tol biopolymer transport system component